MAGWWRQPQARVEQDLAVFEELVARYERQAYRVAYRLTGNHEDAQDLLQEAVCEAFRSFARFERGTRFDRWLYRIMTNRQIDRVRRESRQPVLSLDQVDAGDGTWEVADDHADPGDVLVEDLLDERLQAALNALPREYREAVVLVDMEDLSYEEVARVLRCPIGTVRSRLHRGRMLLREALTVADQGPQ
ncbi:MAG: sigma-70 family RNA polymerase sigma factor [Fimbriimonadaceae bacterium]|nr:sigma-70 family RNA polymerase sigma factor [Fimbriimonadaceae bacterium]